MKLYLIRHGQSEGNVRNLWYGLNDLPLTELGRQQAMQVSEKIRDIPLAKAYVSPLQRARVTAELALRYHDIPQIIVPDLQEQDMGELETLSVEEIGRRDPVYLKTIQNDWVHVTPTGGEPYDTGLAPRVAKVLDSIVAAGEDCAIVAHNGPLRYAVTYLLGLPIDAVRQFYLNQGFYTVIEIDPSIRNATHSMLRRFNA